MILGQQRGNNKILMKQRVIRYVLILSVMPAALWGGCLVAGEGQLSASYLYTLSNFTGVYPISWAKLGVDRAKDEIYVASLTKIKIFNQNGMEVYTFNESGELGWVKDVAVHNSGDIIVLAYMPQKGRDEIIRCDFRGEPISTIELKGLPEEYEAFVPNRVVIRDDTLYLADTATEQVIVADISGAFQKAYDIASIAQKAIEKEYATNQVQMNREQEREKQNAGMTGFTVDAQGNILFTNSAYGRAYQVSAEGGIRSFGQRGTGPGKFGVPGGVITDASGKYLLIADTLRCVVLVFDRDFKFITEFGVRGYRPANLIGPMDVAVDSKNRVYVSQLRNRGVNVYQLNGS
jgi:DNA-binding beta-propeller fold protein YncE